VTGCDNAREATRRVAAFLASQQIPVLERPGVAFGHGPSVYVIVGTPAAMDGDEEPRTPQSRRSPR
jgi:hypothetical protein